MDSLTPPLDAFGSYVIERSYDPALTSAKNVLAGHARGVESVQLHQRLGDLTEDERDAVVGLVKHSLVGCLHDLLHGVSHDGDQIKVFFEGHDVGRISDGLQGDLFAWLPAFSSDPPPALEIPDDLEDV